MKRVELECIKSLKITNNGGSESTIVIYIEIIAIFLEIWNNRREEFIQLNQLIGERYDIKLDF